MKIELNRQAQISLSKQIFQEIADRIQSGYFPGGARLPSIRKLAKELSVSPVTVIQAFTMLEKEKYITRVQGKGTFVNEMSDTQDHDMVTMLQIPDYLHRAQQLYYSQHPAKLNFSLSVVDPSLLPAQILSNHVKELIQTHPELLVQYGEIQGAFPLRQAFAKYLNREKIPITAEDILVTNGSQQGIDLVARCFLGPGDIVITEEVTYPGAIDVFRSRGATVLPVPMDQEGISINHLIRLLDTYQPQLIYTIPTYQNPTGRVMSERRRKQLLEIAEEVNCLILEDDPWSEIYFDAPPPAHIKSFDRKGHVIYLKGLSKMLAPGCRVGFLSAEKSILRRLLGTKTNADMGNPLFNQWIILPIFQQQSLDQLVQQLRDQLKYRRDLSIKLLKKHALAKINWIYPKGGFNIWITLPEHINCTELLFYAKQQGVDFFPGSACYPTNPQHNHLRLSFTNSTEKQIALGIPLLCKIIDEYIANEKQGTTNDLPGF
ncbi:transcriptional regulator, GntR family [Seinonella peptonophila]|uniref:Transcriptional regulator, GntR family n=1 Tax=Seinonella peptonophila TaxID=112248 RepID=A0A1M4SWQ4_9BACL|nr:PLP-dependent aminotransferase family protein [Seinonella peptonophila]SHE36646.1 transcriptional regulator, GntR family [Seinonella peptonophila]